MSHEFERGDHLVSGRRFGGIMPYTHHGLYVGGGRVIHYGGNAEPGVRAPIEEVSVEQFSAGRSIQVKEHKDRRYSREESVARARSRVGEDGYCVFGNNCEHFVNWCITGEHGSTQADVGVGAASSAIGAAGAAAGVAGVSAGGAVAGLSASGTMSGLAYAGSFVGGGAMAGLTVIGALPAAVAATAVNLTVLRDGQHLPTKEREARRVGRVATIAAAGAAAVGNVVAVGTAGTVSGISAAGISSGLAALGTGSGMATALGAIGMSGGAMIGGVVVTVAAPAILATGLGYGAYRATRWLKARGKEPVLLPRSAPTSSPKD